MFYNVLCKKVCFVVTTAQQTTTAKPTPRPSTKFYVEEAGNDTCILIEITAFFDVFYKDKNNKVCKSTMVYVPLFTLIIMCRPLA